LLELLKEHRKLLDGLEFTHEKLTSITTSICAEISEVKGDEETARKTTDPCNAATASSTKGRDAGQKEQNDRTCPGYVLDNPVPSSISTRAQQNADRAAGDSGSVASNGTEELTLEQLQMQKVVMKYAEQRTFSSGGFKNVNRTSMVNILGADEEADAPWWIASPQDFSSVVWGYVIAVCVVYTCWYVPFSIGFNWWRISKVFYYMQYLLEGLFWIDMLQSFRTAFVLHGKLHAQPKQIAKHYLHFWFWVDFAANVPWELILQGLITNKVARKSIKMMKWAKLPKLLRMARYRKLLDGMGGIGQYMRVFTSSCCLAFLAHFFCCLLIGFIGYCEEYPPQNLTWKYCSDVIEQLVREDESLGERCIQDAIPSVYFNALHVGTAVVLGNYVPQHGALGLLLPTHDSGGEGTSTVDVSWFYALATAGEIFGVIMFGILLAHIAMLILVQSWPQTCLWMQYHAVQHELSHYGDRLPLALQKRIQKYFKFRFRQGDYGKLSLLDTEVVNHSTFIEAAFSLYGPVLREIPCFRFSELSVVQDICCALGGRCFVKTEYVYRLGEECLGLYILDSGTVDVQDHTGKSLQTFHAKAVFGEEVSIAQLIFERHEGILQEEHGFMLSVLAHHNVEHEAFRTVDVARALTHCYILQLPLSPLRAICLKHKGFLDKMIAHINSDSNMISSVRDDSESSSVADNDPVADESSIQCGEDAHPSCRPDGEFKFVDGCEPPTIKL